MKRQSVLFVLFLLVLVFLASCNPVYLEQYPVKVAFDAGTGVGSRAVDSTKNDGSYTIPDHKGFSNVKEPYFIGWKLGDTVYKTGEALKITGKGVTLVAQWSNGYLVRFDANGGRGTMIPEGISPGASFKLPSCDFVPPADPVGKKFEAWQVGSRLLQPGDEIGISAPTIVYAVWTPSVAIHFNPGEGSGAIADSSIVQGQSYVLPNATGFNPPTLKGRIFTGWEVQVGLADPVIKQAGEKVIISSETTLTALWTATKTISFDAKGGSGTMAPVDVPLLSSYKLPTCDFVAPAGQAFVGWSVAIGSGNATDKKVGDTVTVSDHLKLTARWKKLYHVLFNFGSGKDAGTGAMPRADIIAGEDYALPACSFVAPAQPVGRVFTGWSVAVGGGTPSLKQPGDTLAAMRADAVATAQWTAVHTVSFEPQSGTGNMNTVEVAEGNTYVLPANAFSAPADHTFAAWSVVVGSAPAVEKQPGDSITISADTVVTALWVAKLDVSFVAGSASAMGSGTMAAVKVAKGSDYALPSCGFSAPADTSSTAGRAFAGWSVVVGSAAAVDKLPGDLIENVTENIVATARWTDGTVLRSISFDAAGGSGTMAGELVADGSAYVLPANAFSAPTDKIFAAWSVVIGTASAVEKQAGESVTASADIVVTATWTDKYEIRFEAGEGTGSMDSIKHVSGCDYVLPAGAFSAPTTPIERPFKAWSVVVGSAPAVEKQPGDTLKAVAADVVVTALWTELSTVSFDAAAGSGSIADAHVITGDDFVLPSNSLSAPADHTFAAWSVVVGSAAAEEKQPGDSITISADTVVTALWVAKLDVSFVAGSASAMGSGTMAAVKVAKGSDYALPSCGFSAPADTSSTAGRAFAGWSVVVGSAAAVDKLPGDVIENVTENIVATARWTDGTVLRSISFDAAGGSGTMAAELVADGSAYVLPANAFSAPTDKIFAAWSVVIGTASAVEKQAGESVTASADIVVTATWTDKYEIRFVAGEGTGSMDRIKHVSGCDYVLPASAFSAPTTPVERPFKAWSVVVGSAPAVEKQPGDTLKAVAADVVVTALWTELSTVSFDAAAGSGSIADAHVITGDNFVLPSNAFSAPADHTFAAWSVVVGSAPAVGKQPGDSITISADTVVTALWVAKLDVSFVAGTASAMGSGTMAAVKVAKGSDYALPSCGFSAPADTSSTAGRAFAGWSVVVGSAAAVDKLPGDLITNVTENIVATARWTDGTVLRSISFEAAGGGGTMAGELVADGSAYVLPANAFSAPTDKIFAAWSVVIGTASAVEKQAGESVTASADIVVTATWTDKYEIRFEAGEGTGSMDSIKHVSGCDYVLPASAFSAPTTPVERPFKAWSVVVGSAPAVEKQPGDTLKAVAADVVVTALWTELSTVSFDAAAGSGSIADDYVITGDNFVLPSNSLTAPADHTFAAWSVVVGSAPAEEKQPGDSITISADTVVTATWVAKLNVSFVAGSASAMGSGTMAAVKVAKGSDYALPSCGFSAPADTSSTAGRAFAGWSVVVGSAAAVDKLPGDLITNVTENIVATARWTDGTVLRSISFEAAGGGGTMAGELVADGSAYVLPANAFSAPTDKIFAAWSVVIGTASAVEKQAGESVTASADIVVTATWKKLFSVTFSGGTGKNAGTGSMAADKVADGSDYRLPDNEFTPPTTPIGRVFEAWRVAVSDASGIPGTPVIMKAGETMSAVSGDVAVTAVWTEVHTVHFEADGGSGTMADVSIANGQTYTLPKAKFTSPDPSKVFGKWSVVIGSAAPVIMERGDEITVSEDVVATAVWDGKRTITYQDGRGGTAGMTHNPETIAHGSSYVLRTNTFAPPATPVGLKFEAWEVGGRVYLPGDTIETVETDLIIVAKWSGNYLISYDGNGIGCTKADDVVVQGTTFALPDQSVLDLGVDKYFIAWIVDGTEKAAGAVIKPHEDMTIKAKWGQKWKVRFDRDDHGWGDTRYASNPNRATPPVQWVIPGEKASAPPTPEYYHFAFDHWAQGPEWNPAFDFANTPITSDIVIKAWWNPTEKPANKDELRALVKAAIADEAGGGGPNTDLNYIDTSLVTDMYQIFYRESSFNGYIDKWDTTNVTNMKQMFVNAQSFNHSINTSVVTRADGSTYLGWDVKNVKSMYDMLQSCIGFSTSVDKWNTSSVTDMGVMFFNCFNFNQPINTHPVTLEDGTSYTAWDVRKVTSTFLMFCDAKRFNQPLDKWELDSVNRMEKMFEGAAAFDQPIGSWASHLGNLSNVKRMFYDAVAFNQDLSNWNLSGIASWNKKDFYHSWHPLWKNEWKPQGI